MPPSLADCWTRWNRAGDHVNSLNEACQAIIKSNGYTFTADCDENGSGEVRFTDRVDPELLRKAATYFGEVVSNLWAARNYLVYQLACLREGVDLPSGWKHLGFPVLKQEPSSTETFLGCTQNDKLRGLSPGDIHLIEAVQPYQSGNPDPTTGRRQADPMNPHHVLEELTILDRHRRLSILPLYSRNFDLDLTITKGVGTIESVTPDQAMIGVPLKDGDIMARFRIRLVTPCELAAYPRAQVEIFPSDVIPRDGTTTFDVWVRRLRASVQMLLKVFETEF